MAKRDHVPMRPVGNRHTYRKQAIIGTLVALAVIVTVQLVLAFYPSGARLLSSASGPGVD